MKNTQNGSRGTLKVPADQLAIGMHVAQLDRPWLETPFLFQGFNIKDEDDLAALQNICDYVYIDVLKSRHLNQQVRSNPVDDGKRQQYQVTTPVEQEIERAASHYYDTYAEVERILQQAYRGETIPTQRLRQHIHECVNSIERNPSAMLWLSRIKHVDHYTAEHCLNVGVLAIALGRHLGVGRQHLELLGLCGMLHDVGKMRVDQDILNKPARLTAEEFDHIKLHAVYGHEILSQDPDLPPEVISAALSHHERRDGTGYPNGVDATNLSLYTRVITVVDAYDAITSRRCYSDGNTSANALKILYEHSGTQFDPALVVKFIECLGIYPPGALVEMSSGEVGVVLSVEPENRLLPKVALLLDANKRPRQQHIVDLKQQREAEADSQLRIKSVLMDGAHGIDLAQFTRHNINLGRQQSPEQKTG